VARDGLVGKLQARILSGVRRFGPATAREICRDAQVPEGWRRFSELRRDGHIKIVGERVCSVTGKTAMVWALGPDLAMKPTSPRSSEVDGLRKQVAELRAVVAEVFSALVEAGPEIGDLARVDLAHAVRSLARRRS
jgi:hypothetical protein